jgi:hypothetical protein
MESNKKLAEYWQQHVQAFSYSGLTRNAYCQKNQIRVYQLDYWRRKLKASQKRTNPKNRKDWIPLQIREEHPVGQVIGIRLRIDRWTIEVDPGFNPELLLQVLRIVGSTC